MRLKQAGGLPEPVTKSERLTKKDVPEYERIKYGLVKVLEKLGGYEPAVDDLLIEQIAHNIIYVNHAEVFLDSPHSTADTYSVVADSKLKLMKIIENAIRELALSRRDRVGKQIQSDIMRELREATLRAVKHGEE